MSWLLLVYFVFDIHVVNLHSIYSGYLSGHSNSTEISHKEKHPKLGGGSFCSQTTPQLFLHTAPLYLVTNTFLHFAHIVFGQLKIEKKMKRMYKFF
jgi:hypothetical protein